MGEWRLGVRQRAGGPDRAWSPIALHTMRSLVAIGLLLLFSCSGGPQEVPDGVLPPERFQQVLLEAQLIEARMNHELVIDHATSIPGGDHYAEMFREQGITQAEFDRSFKYYSGQPEEMQRIYEAIMAELVRRKDELPQ